VWLPCGDAYNWYSGLECCIDSGFDSGFMRRSRHWCNQGHRHLRDWLSELNLGLPCPTRLASVHLPGTSNNDCPQSSCVISTSLVCYDLISAPINPVCSSVFFTIVFQCSPSILSACYLLLFCYVFHCQSPFHCRHPLTLSQCARGPCCQVSRVRFTIGEL
jgi:hypothetical protein